MEVRKMSNSQSKLQFKQSAEIPSSLDIYIYGDIEGDDYDWWTGETIESETSANHFKKELAKYPNATQINLYVNSSGGYVYEAMSIRNQLKRHPAHITAYVDGIAASAASFILTGCDTVKMYSNTMQMVHNMLSYCYGNSTELRKEADNLDKMMEGNKMAYLEKSNGKLTMDKLTELLDGETWLTAQDCLEYGLCDEIIEENVDLDAANKMVQKINNSFQQKIKYNQMIQKMFKEQAEPAEPAEPVNPVEPHKEPEQQEPQEPTQSDTQKQITNYDRLKQLFMKKGE